MAKKWLTAVAIYIATLCTLAGAVVDVAQLTETRYCGTPVRDASGNIKRSAAVLSAFQKLHPCPATGLGSGSCPGWAIDHVIPLVDCGCDAVSNLQWLKNETKSCAAGYCKDRYERKINACPGTAVKVAP